MDTNLSRNEGLSLKEVKMDIFQGSEKELISKGLYLSILIVSTSRAGHAVRMRLCRST